MTELHTTREMAENALYWNLQSYGPNCAEVWISETALQAHELIDILHGLFSDDPEAKRKAEADAREWIGGE